MRIITFQCSVSSFNQGALIAVNAGLVLAKAFLSQAVHTAALDGFITSTKQRRILHGMLDCGFGPADVRSA